MSDKNSLKKPAHVKEHIWQQHLQWLEVVTKQAQENYRKIRKRANERNSADQS